MKSRNLIALIFFLSMIVAACGDERPDVDHEPPVPQDEIGITEQQAALGDITEEEIDKFAEAIIRAEEEWTDADREFSEMEPIIHEVGLSLDRFIEIQNRVEQEPELRSIFEERLEEKRED